MLCRMCGGSTLTTYLDLGYTPPADAFLPDLDAPETWYPLRVALCESCGLSQLTHTVPPHVLFGADYPYEMSVTETGKAHWRELAHSVTTRYGHNNLVVDIGSNVGVLLDAFRSEGADVLGVEPAHNIATMAN